MGMSLVCWTRMLGVDVVKNEQIEEMHIHAVLSVWNISPPFYSVYSYSFFDLTSWGGLS